MNETGRGKGTITLALLLAAALIGGAYFLSGHHLPSPTPANAASSEELLQQYAAKDSDGDGLPDWEEALYGTDPHNPHSVRPDLTDSQAVAEGLVTPHYAAPSASSTAPNLTPLVPGNLPAQSSLTAQFSQLFFNNYLASRGNTPPSASDMQTFVEQAVAQLETTQTNTDAYTESNIAVSGQGADAMRTYAAAVDAALAERATQFPYDELTYFSDAINKNDTTALENISTISKTYQTVSAALVKIPVPQEAAEAHLQMVNAMAKLSVTIADLAALENDPIRAMLGLQEYPDAVTQLAEALVSMDAVFAEDGVAIPVGSGSSFYALAASAAASSTPETP